MIKINGAEVPYWGSIIVDLDLLTLSSTLQCVFLRASLTALKFIWNKAVFSLSFFKLYSGFEGLQLSAQQASSNLIMLHSQVRGH